MPQHPFVRIALLLPLACCLTAAAADPGTATAHAAGAFDWRAFLAPFHTVTLHLPIGFVTLAVILEAYALFRPSPDLRRALALVMWASGISAVVVTILGLFRASGGGYEEEMLKHHEQFGIAVAVVTVALALIHNIAYRAGQPRGGALVAFYRLVLLADMVLLTIAGHGGGNLTHGSKYLVEGAPEWAKQWLVEHPGSDPGRGDGGSGSTQGGTLYASTIRPALEKKCFSCHGAEKQKGDYRMDTVDALFKAGESEVDPIVANKPLESYLVELITLPADDDAAMPPDGKDRLTPEETLAIIEWIWNGAKAE